MSEPSSDSIFDRIIPRDYIKAFLGEFIKEDQKLTRTIHFPPDNREMILMVSKKKITLSDASSGGNYLLWHHNYEQGEANVQKAMKMLLYIRCEM